MSENAGTTVPKITSVIFLAALASGLHGQSPDDLSFSLRLKKDPPEYSTTEPIVFEISLSSKASNKYYAAWTALNPFIGNERIMLEPRVAAVDLRALRQGGFAGSILGSSGYLTAAPVTETGDLTEWYRFQNAGHFRLSIGVDWVSRLKSKEEGRLSVQSNVIEFDVIPSDPFLDVQELASILNEIDHSTNSQVRQAALHRLDLMQTPAATEEKVQRYLAYGHVGDSEYYNMLSDSAQLDQIIPLLEAALTNPGRNPPNGIVDLLAHLQMRKQIRDSQLPDKLEGEQSRIQSERAKLLQQLFAQYTSALLDTIRLRSGSERLNAEFQAWSNVERQYTGAHPTPEVLANLRSEVLGDAKELSLDQQSNVIVTLWKKIPHVDLLPLIEHLATSNASGEGVREEAFRFWCEEWPSDCSKPLGAEAQKADPKLSKATILLIPEREHPELDSVLSERLQNLESADSPDRMRIAAALTLRVGSRNIEPYVIAFLDHSGQALRDGEIDGYFIGYLLRVDPASGLRRLRAALQQSQPEYYASSALNSLNYSGAAQLAVPLAIAALNNRNLTTAGTAALFLGQYGTDSAQTAIWERLIALRIQWHERAAEIRSAIPLDKSPWKIAQFEQQLVSALAHAKNWNLTGEEQQSLAAGCLSEQCRMIAAGKSWVSP